MKFQFVSVSSFFVYLLPAALISGPLIPDLIVTFLSIAFILFAVKEKKYTYFQNNFFYLFLIFWTTCILSSLLSEELFFSLKSSAVFIRFGFFSILIYFIIKNNPNFIKFFYYSSLIAMCILLLDAYTQKFLGTNVLGKSPVIISKISGLFGSEEILGTYLLRISPILLSVSFLLKGKKNIFLIFFYLLIEPMIFYSGQRAIFYMSLIFIAGILIFIKHDKKSLLALLILLAFLFYNLFFDKNYNHRMIKDITGNYQVFQPQNFDKEKKYSVFKFMFYSPNQTILWISSLNIFMENKIIGAGPNTFRKICEQYKPSIVSEFNKCSTHPHNFLFQLLAELGLLGFFIYAAIYIGLTMKLISNLYQKFIFNTSYNPAESILIIAILINFFPLITNGNFFNNYLSIINFLPFGFLLNFKKEKKWT